jgi:uncharacterized protein (DUF362 family)
MPHVAARRVSIARSGPADSPLRQASERITYAYPSVLGLVGECLANLGLDAGRVDSPHWNPLGDLIHPGETVLVKPNLVKEHHPRDPEGWRYVLTHGSVIRAVCEYIWKALDGVGRVIIADAPQTDSSFEKVAGLLHLEELVESYRAQGFQCDLVDLRREEWSLRDGVVDKRRKLAGDPNGYVAFNLGRHSELAGHSGGGRYYGADYEQNEVNFHHTNGRHEYLIAGSAIAADVVFSIPKMKTHKKAGVTGGLKNLVGVNGDKNWLPHHTEGTPASNGDERPDGHSANAERVLVSALRRTILSLPGIAGTLHRYGRKAALAVYGNSEDVIRSGNWHGNDTIWRMCLDLNKAILYGNPDGTLREDRFSQAKRHYVLMDGIIAGEGSGPMNPDPVHAGVLLFGTNAASVDAVAAYLMGFDPELIPIIRQAFDCKSYRLAAWGWRDIEVRSNHAPWNGHLAEIAGDSTFQFRPHFGWTDHIERQMVKHDG